MDFSYDKETRARIDNQPTRKTTKARLNHQFGTRHLFSCIEVKLGFYETKTAFNLHWLEITSHLSNQTSPSLDALTLVDGNDEFDKLSLLRNALNQHIENVSKLCREEELKIATVTQLSLPHVWKYCKTIEKLQTQEQFAKESQLFWQRLRWLPMLLRKPLFDFPTTTRWSRNTKPFS